MKKQDFYGKPHGTFPKSCLGAETREVVTNESVIVIVAFGVVAGWPVRRIAWRSGFGFFGDEAIGIPESFASDRLSPQTGIHLGKALAAPIIDAAIGVIILFSVLSVISDRLGRP